MDRFYVMFNTQTAYIDHNNYKTNFRQSQCYVVLCCRGDLLFNISNLVDRVVLIKADGLIPNIVQYNLSVHVSQPVITR